MKKLIFLIIPLIAFGFLLAVFYIPGSQETTSASNPDNPGDPSVTDSFTNTTMVASSTNLIVDTTAGQVKLTDVCYGIADGTKVPGCDGVCQVCQNGTCGVVANNTQVTGCNGVCQACQSGSCGVANAGTDPGNQCTASGCATTDNCSGTGATCGFPAAGSQPTGCTGCYYCNGTGGCVYCRWVQGTTISATCCKGTSKPCTWGNRGVSGYGDGITIRCDLGVYTWCGMSPRCEGVWYPHHLQCTCD